MENFALSSRKFLLMPSYYSRQEKLFDRCDGVYGLHGNHATPWTPCFIAKTPAALTLHLYNIWIWKFQSLFSTHRSVQWTKTMRIYVNFLSFYRVQSDQNISCHTLLALSGVVDKNIRIVSFPFNPSRSYKDIIGLRTFYHIGNFWTFLQLLYFTVVKFGKAIRHCFNNKTKPSIRCHGNCIFYT